MALEIEPDVIFLHPRSFYFLPIFSISFFLLDAPVAFGSVALNRGNKDVVYDRDARGQ